MSVEAEMRVTTSENDILAKKKLLRSFKSFIVDYDYLFFFLFAFCITWSLAFLLSNLFSPIHIEDELLEFILKAAIPVYGPHLAAVILTYLRAGKSGIKELYSRAVKLNVAPQWYCIAFLFPFIAIFIADILAILGGSIIPPISVPGSLIIIYFFLFLIVPGIGEEIGWRGYAQPALQRKLNPAFSSLIIGVFWALWHFPSFFDPTSIYSGQNFGAFLVGVIAVAVFYGWLYNNTGSIFFPIIYHTMQDLASAVLYAPVELILVYMVIAFILLSKDAIKYIISQETI